MNISVPMTYKDKHGADKTKWVNIGNLVIADDGKVFGDINATPVGEWDGSFSCFDREDKQQNQHQQQHQQTYNAPHGQVPVHHEQQQQAGYGQQQSFQQR